MFKKTSDIVIDTEYSQVIQCPKCKLFLKKSEFINHKCKEDKEANVRESKTTQQKS